MRPNWSDKGGLNTRPPGGEGGFWAIHKPRLTYLESFLKGDRVPSDLPHGVGILEDRQ